ncbi:hypothetical protein GCM10011608_31300 [Micromonospora sonchi]|uniref:Uncharacterized protein n=1 Tax=Micromonospora sonchi TaxID=1763543 RepID=A0A917TY79_9ACTN|nr:hypothetical protein GCM10011608_31300 [Micromonospora sonchi]
MGEMAVGRVAAMATYALINAAVAPAAFGPLLQARPRVRRPALAGAIRD